MFGSVGGMEILLVLVVALLLFGPRKLPQIGKTVGRALSEFRRATTDFKSSLEREVEMDEIRSAGNDVRETVQDLRGVARGSILSPDTPRTVDPEAERPVKATDETVQPAPPADDPDTERS